MVLGLYLGGWVMEYIEVLITTFSSMSVLVWKPHIRNLLTHSLNLGDKTRLWGMKRTPSPCSIVKPQLPGSVLWRPNPDQSHQFPHPPLLHPLQVLQDTSWKMCQTLIKMTILSSIFQGLLSPEVTEKTLQKSGNLITFLFTFAVTGCGGCAPPSDEPHLLLLPMFQCHARAVKEMSSDDQTIPSTSAFSLLLTSKRNLMMADTRNIPWFLLPWRTAMDSNQVFANYLMSTKQFPQQTHFLSSSMESSDGMRHITKGSLSKKGLPFLIQKCIL